MKSLRCIVILLFGTSFVLGQLVHRTESLNKPADQPEVVVRNLYLQIVARHPMGIPTDVDLNALAPYLSGGLIGRIDLALSCEDDYYRQHNDPNEKPAIAWLEFGLFSGANERVSPHAFHIEKTQGRKDGSFRVLVRLTYDEPEGPGNWRVAAVVVREKGHFVVDDIIYLKDETGEVESRLSKTLTHGCRGPRWVGYGEERK